MEEKRDTIKKQKAKKHKKKNIKMFPFYKMVSWDLLFYYPIIFLFLTQVKGFSASQALFADAFYTLSNAIWQIPSSWLVDKIGKKRCLIIGNLLYSVSILAMIFMREYYELLIIQFIYSLGYTLKGLCEVNLLYDSLPAHKSRGIWFSKIEARSMANFLYFDGLSSIIAGYTFAINGYIPLVLCFISCAISTVFSFKFKDVAKLEGKQEYVSPKEYVMQLRESFQFFKKSKRIKSLFLFNAVFVGLMYGIISLRSSLLNDLHVPAMYFGIIFAVLQICAGITSRYQEKIQNIFKNKTLTILAMPYVISCILIGFVGSDSVSTSSITLVLLLYLVQSLIKGPYLGLMSRYLNNFTNKKIRTKITAFKNLTFNLFTAATTALCALLLNYTNSATTFIVIGCIFTAAIVLILDFMRDKVGLVPEKYTAEDVKYSIHKPNIKQKN